MKKKLKKGGGMRDFETRLMQVRDRVQKPPKKKVKAEFFDIDSEDRYGR
jgi:hypothetical protein